MSSWYYAEETENDQILSSRVRLARNLGKYPFQRKLAESGANAIAQEVQTAIDYINEKDLHSKLLVHELTGINQQIFLEKHMASPKFVLGALPKSIYTDEEENVSIMVNEEDHVRIQCIVPGKDLPRALTIANKLDDLIENHLDFAFDRELGYLTSCPTNVGTGLRASYMIHLPCLDRTNLLKKLFPYITRSGLTLRGIYGEGTIPMGSVFQLSNQITTGISENEIIAVLEDVTYNIIKRENQTRDKILSTRQNYLQDKVYRAYGILTYCRKISVQEAMSLLSDIRLGYHAKILDLPKPQKPIYQLMVEIQPGHLYHMAGQTMNDVETDIARADFLRETFDI